MRAPYSFVALALTAVLLTVGAWANDDTPKVKSFTCGPAFRGPGYATVDDFIEHLESRSSPWQDLLMPDDFPEYENADDFRKPLSGKIKVIHRFGNSAIIFVDNKPFRTSPFSAVIFLLERKNHRFHVADFVRKSTGYESYSDVSEPKILKLQPHRFVHFYFTEFLGGRKWDFDTDEFYIVRNERFQKTLTLKNVSAFCSPAAPYREFVQNVDVTASHGRPYFTIERIWSMDGRDDQKHQFTVVFRWNRRTEKFSSSQAGSITLKEPSSWSSEGLPEPPAGRP
jgi:hypothetical protein